MTTDIKTKRCSKCGTTKPVTSFSNRSDHPHLYKSWCKACEADRQRGNVRAKTAKLQAYKMERGCADCGYKKWAGSLDFDHLPEFTKSFNIGKNAGAKTWEQLLAEIAKCEVVCANCHRERTDRRRNVEQLYV